MLQTSLNFHQSVFLGTLVVQLEGQQSQSVHRVPPDLNISTTLRRTDTTLDTKVRGPQRMNLDENPAGDVFVVQSVQSSISINTGWTVFKFGTNIHVLLRMNCRSIGEALTFHLAPCTCKTDDTN